MTLISASEAAPPIQVPGGTRRRPTSLTLVAILGPQPAGTIVDEVVTALAPSGGLMGNERRAARPVRADGLVDPARPGYLGEAGSRGSRQVPARDGREVSAVIHSFAVVIDGVDLTSPDSSDADALYEAGCDDALLTGSGSSGVQRAVFDREAPSFAAAVASAITAIEGSVADARVVAVERLDPDGAGPLHLRRHPLELIQWGFTAGDDRVGRRPEVLSPQRPGYLGPSLGPDVTRRVGLQAHHEMGQGHLGLVCHEKVGMVPVCLEGIEGGPEYSHTLANALASSSVTRLVMTLRRYLGVSTMWACNR